MSRLSSNMPSLLQISLTNLVANFHALRDMTKAEVAPVLKANGYGTGAAKAFEALCKAGAKTVFVATPAEAAELRAIDPGVRIFVLGGFYRDADDYYSSGNFTPVLNSLEELSRWMVLAKKMGRKLPAALHFDTGMNRLGFSPDETARLLDDRSLLDAIDLRLIMSHFACSDEKFHDMNNHQAAAFAGIAEAFPHVPKSLCNSSGIFRDRNWHYDLIRPGNALYGGNPTPETTNPMRPVVDLSVRILQIKPVKAGETAGYGATHIFQNDTSLAVVAIGYADGFHRAGSNKAKLYWNGQACPVAGRVSMDLIICDIGKISGPGPQIGDLLEVLGPNQSVDQLAADCGTIGYEILTSLGKRHERIYI